MTGLDISEEMLAAAHRAGFERLARYDLNDPLSSAGVKKESFDLVISSGTLHFANDLARTLRELGRALAPGGVLAFTFVPPQARAFGPHTLLHRGRELVAELRSHGLEVLESRRFVAYHDKGNPKDPVTYGLILARKPMDCFEH